MCGIMYKTELQITDHLQAVVCIAIHFNNIRTKLEFSWFLYTVCMAHTYG